MDSMEAELILLPTGMIAERGERRLRWKEEMVWIKTQRIVQG